MNDSGSRLGMNPALAQDPRWELVKRIVASPSFVKSSRLCSFLMYICELSLLGRSDEIDELKIGQAIFGRAPQYDSSADGIVRSHASRLRQKLEQYFSEEGRDEPICLLIPKGAYVPVFEPRRSARAEIGDAPDTGEFITRTELGLPKETPVLDTRPKRRSLWILSVALAVACALICVLLIQLHSVTRTPIATHPLWGKFFRPNHSAIIVCSDTSLTTLQDLSRHNIKLAEYLSADYRANVSAPVGTTAAVLRDLSARRYTSLVDLLIITRFYGLPGVHSNQIRVNYSRDVRPNELKRNFVILLGSQKSNPWVEMFETGMNFSIHDDLNRGISSVVNQSPRDHELSHYDSDEADPLHKIYGVVALRHNLRGSRQVLILEGTSMAGTEVASDFVLDDTRLLPFLNKIRKPDGSIPYFEVLLQSSNMNGDASQSEIVAYRISQQ